MSKWLKTVTGDLEGLLNVKMYFGDNSVQRAGLNGKDVRSHLHAPAHTILKHTCGMSNA